MKPIASVLSAAFFLTAGAGTALADEAAKKNFDTMCAACHGATGLGDGAAAASLTPPPANFADKARMGKLTDDILIKTITEGGAAVGKSPLMAGFKGQLTADQIKEVAAYVRKFSK